ncbi:1-acyl-sn-glycerol-3-phosphate acyltransferase [Peredibacter starrii]|uniref:Glycerol-3-phosphate acyltransferase n=1 Tax=Peredibacter starrii TaxID=28202 RepID=A0AAX4HL37_9BACT|nr:1-acyl-sn-glycerol-3-phosphate acyltransferase [Peredibacter starrii]WPU64027.1 1-acyl-sn-glycerol-3-phosphate acyltransferase [Peredibacter starrii]
MFSDNALDIVLTYPKLQERLQAKPEDVQKIKKLFKEIHGEFSPTLVKSAAAIVDMTFLKLYDGVNLEVPPGMDFHELKKKNHIVLVPNHQSHADYVALTYSMFKNFEVPIRVAAGINLNVFPLGQFFGKAGAFFIRRSFTSDHLYKLTFEGYIYYLLKTDQVVEFFFEGGRTRTGKLLKPKYGLFQMLLEAHSQMKEKPLMFIPVSLAHEHIPEEKAHARELGGGKKVPERGAQLFKLIKLVNKRLGTIHIHFGDPLVMNGFEGDLKEATQKLAFSCFTAVGRGMPITPSSLLALIMLDEPSGALTWKQIEDRAIDVIDYCRALKIPMTPSLDCDSFRDSLRSALDMFIGNKKIEVLKREKLNQVYYVIKDERRVEVLYHKNMILHHFLVPAIINATWFNVFNGSIKDGMQLTRFLMAKRKELKYEFYLPSAKEMIKEALNIISYALGRRVESLEECMKLSSQELYQLATKVRRFSTALSYLYEAYYISSLAVKYLSQENFTQERFIQVAKELFALEIEHGRVVKYPESFAVPIIKDTLIYHQNAKVIDRNEDRTFKVVDQAKLDESIEKFIRDLNDQVAINLKFNKALP